MQWLWIVPWLEVLCLLAVVFAFGIGIGFGGSALARRLTRKSRPKRAMRPAPVVMEKSREPLPAAVSIYPETAVPTTPELAPQPAPIVRAAEPQSVAEPPPAEPSFQTITHREMTHTAYRPATPFSATITRPAPGQPLS